MYKDNYFKSYMDYRAITDKNSYQYKLIHSEKISICSDGLLRDKNGFIAVALGSYYSTKIGERFIITFENGNKIKVITCDAKADKDTINGANHKTDGSMIEMIIDVSKAKKYYPMGIKMGDFNYEEGFQGNIIKIVKVVN